MAKDVVHAVEFAPVRRGRWVFDAHVYDYICSNCGCDPDFAYHHGDDPAAPPRRRFCPWCGAKMEIDAAGWKEAKRYDG